MKEQRVEGFNRAWGKDVLTIPLERGQAGIPALPLRPPFGIWVAQGIRKVKYLNHGSAGHALFYLYQSAKPSPADWFDDDEEKIFDEFIGDGTGGTSTTAAVDEELRRRIEQGSAVRKALIGIAHLDFEDDGVFEFDGGALLPAPIPLGSLVGRPYGGIFYPFGR